MKILLHDELRYPYLGRDGNGYVLHLIKPKRLDEKHVLFQGLKFNLQNPTHKKIVWFLFKASVYHLCMHLELSNFAAYSKWGRGKNPHMATFVISLVEDAIINKRIANTFPWMQPEIAYANTISFLRMRDVAELPNDSSKIMVSLLQNYNIGKVKGKPKDYILIDAEAATSILKRLEENATFEERLDAATKIYDAINIYGETFEVPSLLYTESHGTNDLFYEPLIPKEEEIQQTLSEALRALSTEAPSGEKLNEALQGLKESEAQQALTAWREYEEAKSKILRGYAEVGKGTKFDDFAFPTEDYSEFQRKRELLSSPIRRILHQLRLLKNVGGEDFRQESGFVDLQEAIQVIASKSQRTDIFVREELQTREDTWSILVDASHSLSLFKGEVQGIALCLAEVARMLILDQNSWGLYAFNNKFYVVKDFSEKYDAHVKARIGGLVHGGLTYLPDAVMLAAQALTKRLEESKILVIVSDFFPAGYDSAEEKLKENIKSIEKKGIGVIGIGVNSRAVRNYVRVNCVVEEPYELMKKFTKAFMEYNSS